MYSAPTCSAQIPSIKSVTLPCVAILALVVDSCLLMSDDDYDAVVSRFASAVERPEPIADVRDSLVPVALAAGVAVPAAKPQKKPKPSLGYAVQQGAHERHRWSHAMHAKKRKVVKDYNVKSTMAQLESVASELSKHVSRAGVRLSAKSVRDKHRNARGSIIRIFRHTKRSSGSNSRFLPLTPQTTLDIAYSKGSSQ